MGNSSPTSTFPSRMDFHVSRKLFHCTTGITFALINQNVSHILWRIASLMLFVAVFSVEILRIRSPSGSLNNIVIQLFRPFLRSHETRQFSGTAYYIAGIALSAMLFPRDCATVGIVALAVVDPTAAFFGTYFEPILPQLRLRHGKSVAGLISSALLTALVVFAVLSSATFSSLDPTDAWMISVLIAAVAAVTEFVIPSPRPTLAFPKFPLSVDDNMLIPIISTAALDSILRFTYHSFTLSPHLVTLS